jgi:hypothetical protein
MLMKTERSELMSRITDGMSSVQDGEGGAAPTPALSSDD